VRLVTARFSNLPPTCRRGSARPPSQGTGPRSTLFIRNRRRARGPALIKGVPPALRRIRSNVHEAAQVMGADPSRVWREVDLRR